MSISDHDDDNFPNHPDDDCDIETARGHATIEDTRYGLEELYRDRSLADRYSIDEADGNICDTPCSEERSYNAQNNGPDENGQKWMAVDSKVCTPSIGDWVSICKRRLVPVASSTPLVGECGNSSTSSQMPPFSSSSLASTDDDPVLFYGAPMPGTSTGRKRRYFRHIFSIDEEANTPTPERVQDAPVNSLQFIPKLTSTADDSEKLDSPNNLSPVL